MFNNSMAAHWELSAITTPMHRPTSSSRQTIRSSCITRATGSFFPYCLVFLEAEGYDSLESLQYAILTSPLIIFLHTKENIHVHVLSSMPGNR